MTRHRRDDEDGLEGDAPWRAKDYERAARPPEAAGDYRAGPGGSPSAGAPRPARGALGTSSGRDDRPGEETGPPWERTAPPWELPGWNNAVPAQRGPRDGGAHPSGPLPRVSTGPLPRLSPESWPSAVSGPLPPVPRESDEAGYAGARRAAVPGSGDDTRYLRTGSADPGYRGQQHGGDTGADHPGPGLPGTGFASGEYPAGGGTGGSGYPGTDPGRDDSGYGDSFASRGRHGHDDYTRPGEARGGDYAAPGYDREPGYQGEPGYSAGTGYEDEPGYAGESGYRGGGDYPGGDYPAEPGYAEAGYPRDDYQGQAGYPAGPDDGYPGHDDTGYQAAGDYASGPPRDRYGRALPDDPDDRGYGDAGGWYGDVDDDQAAWGDEGYDEGLLPGFSEDTDLERARGRAPAVERGPRGPRGPRSGPDRPRGGKPKRRSAMRRAAPWLALIVLVTVLGVGGAGFYYVWNNYLHPRDYSGPGTGNVTVQIKSGETATQVGQQLLNQGVVASVRAFSNAAKASGKGSSLQPGYYRLHKHMAAALAFALLLKPSSRIQLTVVIPEGMRLSEIIAILGNVTGNLRGYQQAIKDVSALGLPSYAKGNPEGYLFPATYTVQPGTQPIQVLRAMALRFNQEAQSVNLPAAAAHGQISQADAITVASLVQAEGKRPQDLAKIARVIYNRLNAGMNLQLDTTVLYARHSRAADVTVPQTQNTRSAYNTYLHAGLPPGPIDSPGDAAIRAALHPAAGGWLYFLTVNPNTGLTKFTSSYSVFQTYVAELNAYNASHH